MQPGTRIGDYELIRPLGSGGMAQVWQARNLYMKRLFAIKFILPQLAANPEIQNRFRDEAWKQSGLHHPNIVQITTVLTENGQNFIVMEYVENGLDKYMNALAGRPMPVPESIDIALQVLDALEYTHTLAEGALIHRDIKPGNILLQADGTVKLTDFGIALATYEARKTTAGQILGTALYMSPEQIAAPSRVGPQTDIYSFACVLFEMLTGRPPFGADAETEFKIQSDHVNRAPDPIRAWNGSVPERFEWIVQKALAKDPKDRFQSCREMAEALLIAYRAEGLPTEMLRSYRGGLTSSWPVPLTPASLGGVAAGGGTGGWQAIARQPGQMVPGSVTGGLQPATGLRENPPVAPGLKPVSNVGLKPGPGGRKPWFASPIVLLLLVILLGLGGFAAWWFAASETILRLEGSTSVGDKLAPALAAEFLTKQLHAEGVETRATLNKASDGTSYQTFEVSGRVGLQKEVIRIVSNGSGKAFTALANQSADLGMSSRPYTDSDPAELNYLPASNSNEHVVALDGIAVIVNSSNRVQTLSLEQLKRVFTGAVTQWSEVPGAIGVSGRIHCYGRESSSGTFEMFRNKVVGKSGTLSAIEPGDQFTDGKALVEKIGGDPQGIGYVTFTQASGVRSVAISDQGTSAMYPNGLTVSTEDYVLTRRLYLYQPHDSSKTASDFISFAQGEAGQAVVNANGFVSLLPKVHDQPAPADAPEEYRAAVQGLGRLGVSFRFTSGAGSLAGGSGYALDSLAQDNILRLKTYQEEHPSDEITLLGFTDSQHSLAKSNRELSVERAQSVAEELKRSGIQARVVGLGDEMPVASNLTPEGRAKNRRVEVWVKVATGL